MSFCQTLNKCSKACNSVQPRVLYGPDVPITGTFPKSGAFFFFDVHTFRVDLWMNKPKTLALESQIPTSSQKHKPWDFRQQFIEFNTLFIGHRKFGKSFDFT